MKLIDMHNLKTSWLKSEVEAIKQEMHNIPRNVYDIEKRDIQVNTYVVRELVAELWECDDPKHQINNLTTHLGHTN